MKVIPWIQRYVSKEMSAKLQPYAERGTFGSIPWDWKLNQALGWRFDQEMKQAPPGTTGAKPHSGKGAMSDSS